MAGELFANVPATTVSSGGTGAPASGTPETWTVASATGFPVASSPPGTQFHLGDPAADTEIVAVTNTAGTTWSVTRGAENTVPVAHLAGFTVVQVITAGFLTSLGPVTPTAVQTGAYTAQPGDFVKMSAASAGQVITLPAGPPNLTAVGAKMVAASGTNTVTIAASGPDVFNVAGGGTTLTLSLLFQAVMLRYESATAIWDVYGGDLPLGQLETLFLPIAGTAVASDALVSSGTVVSTLAAAGPSAGQVLTAGSGTTASWVTPASGFTNPMTTLGDIIYENASPAAARLAGSTSAAKNFLTQTGTGTISAAPAWGTITAADVPLLNQSTTSTASNVTGVVAIVNGGTGTTTAAAAFAALSPLTTLGDTLYENATPAGTRLAGNITTTKNFLVQTGNGTISAAPAWGTISAADVPALNQNTTGTASNVTGVVAVANGGSGTTTASAAFNVFSPLTTLGDMIYENAAPSGTRLAGNTATQEKFLSQAGNGTISAAPAWNVVPGQFLCAPNTYQPGSQVSFAVTATTFAAVASGTACTNSFTAPPSGKALVTASFTAQTSGGGDELGFAIAQTGGVSPLMAPAQLPQDSSATTPRPFCLQFLAGTLTPGSTYQFDLLTGAVAGAVTVIALGATTGTVPALRGGPVTMSVQAI